jgi:hypothetical protein
MPDVPGTINFPTAPDSVVTLFEVASLAATELTIVALAADTTLTVLSTALFPATGSVRVGSETIVYTGTTSTTFTGCVRGQDGTLATAHAIGAAVENRISPLHHEALRTAILRNQTKIGFGADTPANGKFLKGNGPGYSEWSVPSADDLSDVGITSAVRHQQLWQNGTEWVNQTGFIFRVRNRQAVGDGVTDDTTAILNTINDAVAAGGGTVELDPLSYKVTSLDLTAKNNVELAGTGVWKSTLIGTAGQHTIRATAATNNIAVRNLKISNPSTANNAFNMLDLTSVDKLTIERVWFTGIEYNQAALVSCTDVRVRNCLFEEGKQSGAFVNNVTGLYVSGCTGVDITGNHFREFGNGSTGVNGALWVRNGSSRVTIEHNHFDGYIQGALCFVSNNGATVRGVTITSNVFENNYVSNCIFVSDGATDGTITGNVCIGTPSGTTSNGGDWAIEVGGTDAQPQDWTIDANTVYGHDVGIGVRRAQNVSVGTNTCVGQRLHGIYLFTDTLGTMIGTCSGNTASGCGQNGINVQGGGGEVYLGTISSNTIEDCGYAGIYTDALRGVIGLNKVRNCGGGGGATNRAGIHIKDGTNVVAVGNRCWDTRGPKLQTYGLESSGTSDVLTVVGNDFSDNLTGPTSLVGTNVVLGNMPLSANGGGTYTATNVTPDRAFDADTVLVAELADVVGTLIADLRAKGIVQ